MSLRRLLLVLGLGCCVYVGDALAQLRSIQSSEAKPIFPSQVVTITRFGVHPKEIIRPEGPFVLFIQNFLDDHNETYQLVQEGKNASLVQLKTEDLKHRDYTALDLTPGKYRLLLTRRSDLSVSITINAK